MDAGDATIGDLISELKRVYGDDTWKSLKLEDIVPYENNFINNTNTTHESKEFFRVFIQS